VPLEAHVKSSGAAAKRTPSGMFERPGSALADSGFAPVVNQSGISRPQSWAYRPMTDRRPFRFFQQTDQLGQQRCGSVCSHIYTTTDVIS